MNLEIQTPVETLFKGKVNSINVPGSKGSFTVLHNHAAIISTLKEGQIKIESSEFGSKVIDIIGGIIEVKKNNIIVLADLE